MDGGVVLKKGPWTAAEDETLAAYVREYGEGNWNAVQKKTWLARCGKSCRLRWANHLRPNLRKGSFSAHEERLVIQLHSQLGNKWARMAAQLPGRTDNEIKNYWNTRLKRFQRQGLPLYPPDISPNNHHEPSSPTRASSFTFQPKRCHNTAFAATSSYHSTNPVYSTSLPAYDSRNQNLNNTDLHITTCQLLEDLMDEALGCRDPKRRKFMPAPEHHNNNNFSPSLTHFASSNNLSPPPQGNQSSTLSSRH